MKNDNNKYIKKSIAVCLIGALVGAGHVLSQETPSVTLDAKLLANAETIRKTALQGSGAYDLVASLTREVGHRFAGSDGDKAAVAWALTTLTDLGFRNVRAENVEVPRWERGVAEVSAVEPFPQKLAAVALGGSVGTGDEGLQAPVIQVASLEDLEKLDRTRVAGKIVFINNRMNRTRDGSDYSRVVKARRDGPDAASRLGAVGFAMRSAGTSSNRFAHTGMTKYKDTVPRIPAVALSNPDADLLEHQFTAGGIVSVRMRLTSRNLGTTRSANVIGEIPGARRPNEIVLLGAHLDSWDLGTGAIDDGTGVAVVTSAAHLIDKLQLKPDRTLRVVLFANEEFGLSGAKAYAAAHAEEIPRHVLGLESDFGAGRIWRFTSRVPESVLPLADAVYDAVKDLGIERGPNDSKGGADIGVLRKLGMPVMGLNHDGTYYFDYHHTDNDTLDKVNAADVDQAVAAYAAVAYLAASIETDFGRLDPENEKDDQEATPAESADTE